MNTATRSSGTRQKVAPPCPGTRASGEEYDHCTRANRAHNPICQRGEPLLQSNRHQLRLWPHRSQSLPRALLECGDTGQANITANSTRQCQPATPCASSGEVHGECCVQLFLEHLWRSGQPHVQTCHTMQCGNQLTGSVYRMASARWRTDWPPCPSRSSASSILSRPPVEFTVFPALSMRLFEYGSRSGTEPKGNLGGGTSVPISPPPYLE